MRFAPGDTVEAQLHHSNVSQADTMAQEFQLLVVELS